MSNRTNDILAKLFGSANRIKIIRLFLLNPEEVFPFNEISRRAKVGKQACRREILFLKNIGFVKPKIGYVVVAPKTKRSLPAGRQGKPKKKKIHGWKLNEFFPLLSGLKNFILDTSPVLRDQLLKKLQKTGRIKLVILAGIFGEDNSSPVDILVVGDAIKKGALDRAIRDIEAEVGKELTYAFFSTQDFSYRMGMYDKFIRDILDYPHEKILNKLGI